MIPYAQQAIDQFDIDAVCDVLRSSYLTQGPKIPEFELCIAEQCAAKFVSAVNSATSALHLAYKALGVGEGDIVWTVPNTFPATSNAALICGAKVDFVDIDPVTYNMSVSALEEKLVKADKVGMIPKVVTPVHFSGLSCDMKAISALAQKYGFYVVEDASHAIGATYVGKKVGCCEFSDITVFSFHPVKIITTGEGGAIVTNNKAIHDKVMLFRSHGITRNPELFSGQSEGDWFYQQIELGPNYRITDIQAALGISQLRKLEEFILRRQTLARQYFSLFEGADIGLPDSRGLRESSWHLYVVQVPAEFRKDIFMYLKEAKICPNVHYIPVHTHPYYTRLGFKRGDFPISEKYYSQAISLPMYAGLRDEQQEFVAEKVIEVLRKCRP
jgi:UDP-4-amino-4,6-dideoxy-N-acetyl-beta-L-altrosamine transaminase